MLVVIVRVTHKGIANVEHQFELQFGIITLYPHLICQASPYSGGINEQQVISFLKAAFQKAQRIRPWKVQSRKLRK